MKVGPLPRVSLHRTPTSINQVFYKGIDHPNRIVPIDPVFQALRKQRRLPAIDLLNEEKSVCAPVRALRARRRADSIIGIYAHWRLPTKSRCAAVASVVDEQLSAAKSCTQPARAAITSENVVNIG
jgi:hypothetical protein